MSNNIKAYTIDDIASWQTELQESKITTINDINKITLPSLQRGFVWKPYQIEALWDSILRGYPVGAILMSFSGNSRELLDGQQRSTSIALGYYNPFDLDKFTSFLNLKENIPSVWIDLKPAEQNLYGLKYSIRVLTRSHPWGYQLNEHKKTLSMSDRENALSYFRKDNSKSYTELKSNEINPWDAFYPVPLNFLLSSSIDDFSSWKYELFEKINNLNSIKTKHSKNIDVNFLEIEDRWLLNLYKSIVNAKKLLIPEILINKEIIEEDENFESEIEESSDATLFIRLNSEGTRISGEELVYSLLKANFPKLKLLVEKIGMKYISPSKIVNLFSRLSVIKAISKYDSFHQEINITTFRKYLKNQEFKQCLLNFIGDDNYSEAEILIQRALYIITESRKKIPSVLSKEVITKSPDLFLILLIYLDINKDINENEIKRICNCYYYLTMFNTDQKKTANQLFSILKLNEFNDFCFSVKQLSESKSDLLIPLINPNEFNLMLLKFIMPQFIQHKKHFSDINFLSDIISTNQNDLDFLFIKKGDVFIEEIENKNIHDAASFWKNISGRFFWNRTFLVFSQRDYFHEQFGTFMEFDEVEDTNRPWDWDHIYPNSWVYSKQGVSILVRWLVNTNGNFRALSYNENRSQSNHQSPEKRFLNNNQAIESSFIKNNDLKFWLDLTNDDNRLLDNENNKKVDSFVNACFVRVCNLYSDWFEFFEIY